MTHSKCKEVPTHILQLSTIYEGRSKSFATQYDAQMTQAKFLCYYSI